MAESSTYFAWMSSHLKILLKGYRQYTGGDPEILVVLSAFDAGDIYFVNRINIAFDILF